MTSWTARVDWLHPGYNMTELDELLDALEGLSPAIGLEPKEPGHSVRCSAIITLEATSLRQATTAALQAVESATDIRAAGIEVLNTQEFDRRQAEPSVPDLVGNIEIADILGVSRQRAAQLQDLDGFPPAIADLRSGPVRIRSQVEGWAKAWQRKPGRRPSAAVENVGSDSDVRA